ncbi:MAG: hypothetical protein ACOYYS_26930 [Chloroflexota bacterium]
MPGQKRILSLTALLAVGTLTISCSSHRTTTTPGASTHITTASLVAIQSPTASTTRTASETATPAPTNTPADPPTETPPPTLTPTPTETLIPTADTRLLPDLWSAWTVLPTVSGSLKPIYLRGKELGNDPNMFTRIGDCQSLPEVFLGIYDTDRYWLGEDYKYLQGTIDHFAGAFSTPNVTVKDGYGVNSVFSPLMADPEWCESNETPLACEYRLHKPSVAFISMGTNWAPGGSGKFEEYLRQIVDFCFEHGIIPVLMTKADNIEQDNLLNKAIARVAYDYDIPMINVWAALQYMPNHGLQQDGIYLTPDAWDERTFDALITLDRIRAQMQQWDAETP